jgi:two-component system, chemotaxis family, response regulator PixG
MLLTKLIETLEHSSKRADENLTLSTPTAVWDLFLIRGDLLYASDQSHPVRRLNRALKQHCPTWNWIDESFELLDDRLWQLHILEQAINRKQLSLARTKLIIRSIAQECLFELSCCTDLKVDRRPHSIDISANCRSVALSVWEMRNIQSRVEQMWQRWQSAGLVSLNPALSPTLKRSATPQALPIAEQYLNGQFTLWDIALELEKSVVEVAQSLVPWAQRHELEFQPISDLPFPHTKQVSPKTSMVSDRQVPRSTTSKPLLIACIDDSPVLAHSLKKILVPAGYQMLSIQEPMRGFAQLIEHRPDLILLDLLLPNADGYSICKFLRDTPVFEKTPIIILTGQNTSIDRMRAKLAGATEFLTKPPHSHELLQLVRNHIGLTH